MQLSAAVARSLEGYWGDQSANVANELAVLHEVAREFGRAAKYFQLGAERANQVFAAQEAVQLARRGLAMVEMLPKVRERSERELSLQVVLGNGLFATRGFGAPEVQETYSRARELCQQIGETPHLLPVLYGLCVSHNVKANLRKGLELGKEFLALAERQRDPAIVVAHRMMGSPLFFLGELTQARYHYEQVVSIYNPAQHRALTWLYGQEPGMNGHLLLAMVLWLLGYPERALAHDQEAIKLGREVTHANSQAYLLFYGAMHHQFRQDWRRVRGMAEALIAQGTEQGLELWLGYGMTQRGWTLAEQGQMEEGSKRMRQGLQAVQATGAELHCPFHLCLLAEAYGKAGQTTEGLGALAEARALAEKNEERYWEAELHRLRGELLLMGGAPPSEVEQCLHQSIEIARGQQAKSLELRAAMSLSRLWQRQGKREEARLLLTEIYGWFTEGFDTTDLKEARALLDELS
jgi:predicted ATPase